jgi:hypothetical protein
MIMTITNRAHPEPLKYQFSRLLPPPKWGKYEPTTEFDGFEGAFDFLWHAIHTYKGKVAVCDVDFFVWDWTEVHRIAWQNWDTIVSEASIPHRVAMPEHIGNPFFWVFDAPRARKEIAASGLSKEGLRTYGASGVMHAEPFWGLYDFLYRHGGLPYQPLDVTTHADGVATVTDFGVHTWYAREYTTDTHHRNRIDQHFQWAKSKQFIL